VPKQRLQCREIVKWSDHASSERSHLVLGLVARFLPAWQIFGGSLSG
jgi:hypothetical protein